MMQHVMFNAIEMRVEIVVSVVFIMRCSSMNLCGCCVGRGERMCASEHCVMRLRLCVVIREVV